jgi:hypothetical protein
LAGASISVLAGIGAYETWKERLDTGSDLLALAATLGPAAAYAFGYFRCLPDVLGAPSSTQSGTLWQRWLDFARLSAVVAVLITWVGWALAIIREPGYPDAVKTAVALLVVTSLMPACVVASEEYLARTMVRGNVTGGTGWRVAARRLAGRWGAVLVKWLSAKRSLATGSTLALASLILNTTLMGTCGGDPRVGYEIISGKAMWITAAQTAGDGTVVQVILAQAGHWAYVLGLLVSVVGLVGVLAGRAGDGLRGSRPLAILSGTVALFGVSDFLLAWEFSDTPQGFNLALRLVVWTLPIGLWLWRSRGDPGQFAYTRLAVMVLYLPILFSCLALLPILVSDLLGYAFFLLGMLLVWWGTAQSQWEVAAPP